MAAGALRKGIGVGYGAMHDLGVYRCGAPPVMFVTEGANWTIHFIGKGYADGIEAVHPGTIGLTHRPYKLFDRIVHFGSQFFWRLWAESLSPSNRAVVTFFHGKHEDGPEMSQNIDYFLSNLGRLERVVTAASLVERRLLQWGVPREKLVRVPLGVDTSLFYPPGEEQRRAMRTRLGVPDGAVVTGSVSIGMATYPDHAVAMKDLFLFADNMMYRAKAEGKNRVVVPDAQDVIDVFRTLGEKSMLILNAVEKRSVVPFFQPIINVLSGEVEAIEVLSRIRMEDGRYIIADEYVAIAEKMGVMHKLDFIQLEKTLEAVETTGYSGYLFINMSPRALVLNDFVQETRRIASQFRIDPTRLVFEITERETIKNMALLERFIGTLRSEGFKLAIDDFGSGFSSFHYVKRFPIDFLKIEGDFILGMKSSEKDRALVRSIVTLSKDLGIRTVAEYVEDQEVLDQVVAQGIDLAQGFYIHRPNISMAEAMRGRQGLEMAAAAGS